MTLSLVAGLTVLCLLPGYLLVCLLFPERAAVDGLERALLGAGLGLAVTVVVGLLGYYTIGIRTPGDVLLPFVVLVAILLALVARRRVDLRLPAVPRGVLLHAVVIVIAAAALRLPNLGYAEFQGDEATIMLKAAAAVQGRGDVLFIHKKGPAEILVPALLYGLAGRIDETSARLPFALATIVGLLALYQVGRAMFGSRVGLVAALILSVNGFFVAFGRIVQYQAIVFAMSALALLAAWRHSEGGPRARRFLVLSAFFVAVGLLAHYDTLLVVPAVAWLAAGRWRREPGSARRDARALALGIGLAGVILAAFYVPMVRHPYFRETTWAYLFELRLGGEGEGMVHNTLPNALALASFYNSTYYLGGLAVALLASIALALVGRSGAAAGRDDAGGATSARDVRGRSEQRATDLPARERRRSWLGAALTGLIALGAALLLVRPEWWRVGANDWGLLFLLGATVVLAAWRGPTPAWKALLLWFAVPFIFYTAVIASPRTHIHVAFAAWSLLAAVAVVGLGERMRRPAWRRVWAGALTVVGAVCAWYVWLMFVQHDIEYRRVFPATYPAGYWRPAVELPANGWFGFPYRAGWKAIGRLYDDGTLQGTYWSNEEEKVTTWYTRGAPRCDDDPRYYFVAEDVQDEREVPSDLTAAGYAEIGRVTSEGRERIRVYERGADDRTPVTYAIEAPAAAFARDASGPTFEPGLPYVERLGFVQHDFGERGISFSGGPPPFAVPGDAPGEADLRGYALDTHQPTPGGDFVLTLYWQSVERMLRDYSVFVHLVAAEDETRTVAQSDGAPGVCRDQTPTTTWVPRRIYVDRHVLRIPADTPPGDYVLEVGLYDYETLERLAVGHGADSARWDHYPIRDIRIEPASTDR